MTARWITSLEEFTALAPVWDAGLAAAASDNPFLLSDFLLTWCRAFLPPGSLRVLVCEREGVLAGGLPLYLARRAPGVAVLRPLGCGFANWTEPFFVGERAGSSEAMWQALRALPGWRYLSLPLARTPLGVGLPESPRRLSDASIRFDPAWRAAGDYLATRPAKLRANLHRLQRRAHGVATRFARESEPSAVAALIEFQLRHNGPDRYPPDRIVSPSRAAWKGFTRELLVSLAAAGRLDAMALRFDGKVAAAGFGFRYGPGYKSMLISRDARLGPLGPGYQFLYHLIDWCLARREPELQMFGETPEKRRWCNTFTPLYATRVFPATGVGRLLARVAR